MSSGVTLSITCTEAEFETASEQLKKAGIHFIVEKSDFSNESSSMQPITVDELREKYMKRKEGLGSKLRLVFVGVSDRSSSSITTKASEDSAFKPTESSNVEGVNKNSDYPIERPVYLPCGARTLEDIREDFLLRRKTLSSGVTLLLTQSSSSTTLAEHSCFSPKAYKDQTHCKMPKHQKRGKGNPR